MLARPAAAGAAGDPAGYHRRHGWPAARPRPALPANLCPGAVPEEEAGPGPTARGGDRGGNQLFVADRHHGVSIAAASRQHLIDAYVTQVLTRCRPGS